MVATSKAYLKTSRFPYLSASFFDIAIPIIPKSIPPALNKPNPAETGSEPKKLTPIPTGQQ